VVLHKELLVVSSGKRVVHVPQHVVCVGLHVSSKYMLVDRWYMNYANGCGQANFTAAEVQCFLQVMHTLVRPSSGALSGPFGMCFIFSFLKVVMRDALGWLLQLGVLRGCASSPAAGAAAVPTS
jgi:hypothetical protein